MLNKFERGGQGREAVNVWPCDSLCLNSALCSWSTFLFPFLYASGLIQVLFYLGFYDIEGCWHISDKVGVQRRISVCLSRNSKI